MSKSVATVTGASQGIGQATAVRPPWRDVSALDSGRAQPGQSGADGRGGKGHRRKTLVIDADLAEPSAAQAVVDQTLATFGRIDAFGNIAGAVTRMKSLSR